jgi:hypothetical protein
MSVKIKAKLVTALDLEPGDLFSAAGPSYWDTAMDKGSIGEMVYIRTRTDANRAPDANDVVYHITIERDEEVK